MDPVGDEPRIDVTRLESGPTVAERIDLLERQVSFLQCACGLMAGAIVGAALWFASEKLLCGHKDRDPSGRKVEPELPVRQPMADDRTQPAAQRSPPHLDFSVAPLTNELVVPPATFPVVPVHLSRSPE